MTIIMKIAVLGLGMIAVMLLIAVVAGARLSGSEVRVAQAHYDPPRAPPIRVIMEVTGVASDVDVDDFGDSELEIDNYTVARGGDHAGKSRTKDLILSDNYDWDKYLGAFQDVDPPIQLYSHDECTPMDKITIALLMEEDDDTSDDDSLGTGSLVFTTQGVQTLQTANNGKATGKIRINVRVVTLTTSAAEAQCASFIKTSMPDLGQHSSGWCWVAAFANSIYWYAKFGPGGITFPALLDSTPGDGNSDDKYWTDMVGPSGSDTDQYRRLLKEIADDGGKVFSQGAKLSELLAAYVKFVRDQGLAGALGIHVVRDTALGAGITGCAPPDDLPVPGLTSDVKRPPTLNDYRLQLARSEDVMLIYCTEKPDGTPLGNCHMVTGVAYDLTKTPNEITVSNPATHSGAGDHDDAVPGAGQPDHNNAPGHANGPYDVCKVDTKSPLRIDCPSGKVRVYAQVFMSPIRIPVGGTAELLVSHSDNATGASTTSSSLPVAAPLAAAVLAVVAGGGLYVRRRLVG